MTEARLIVLKPCPFCRDGGDPYVHAIGNEHTKKRGAEVGCKECRFTKEIGVIRYSVEWAVGKATEAWNSRAEQLVQCGICGDHHEPDAVPYTCQTGDGV